MPERLTDEQIQEIEERWKRFAEGNPVLFLDLLVYLPNFRSDISGLFAEIKALKQEWDEVRKNAALEALKIAGEDMRMYWRLAHEHHDPDAANYNRARAHEASSLQDQFIQHFGLPLTARISEGS